MRTLPALLLLVLLTSCATRLENTTLKPSPYGGDAYLYRADQIIVLSYSELDEFVKWEKNFRALINNPKVKAHADYVRANARKWVTSAIALREAYSKIPDANVQDELQAILNTITEAINQSLTYMAQNKITINIPPP